MSDFPPSFLGDATQAPCFTIVSSTLPVADIGALDLSALLLHTAASPAQNPAEIPQPAFVASCYSAKDRATLYALSHLRSFFLHGTTPSESGTPPGVGIWVKRLAKRLSFDGSSIWKLSNSLKLKVLESPSEILPVLRELHDGFGHRGLAAVLHHFQLRYWIPASAKVIRQYISGCSACQKLASPLKFEVPSYQIQPNDVFSHWLVDCVGPFPADPRTGDLYVIISCCGLAVQMG